MDGHLTRRTLAGGFALAAATPGAVLAKDKTPKAPEKPLFADGPLARNPLARQFTVPSPELVWPPKVKLTGFAKTKTTIEAYRGKVLIVSLWAEWCTPCMVEMPGFAVLQEVAKSDKVQILPILTASQAYYRPDEAIPLLKKIGAEKLNFLMDEDERLPRKLAYDAKERNPALPCNLIVDADGRIRGRAMGSAQIDAAQNGKTDKYSVWATNIALQFVQGLANGALA